MSQSDIELAQNIQAMTEAMLVIRKKENKAADELYESVGRFTLQQLTVLNVIGEFQPCSMSHIAKEAKLAMSTVTSVLNRLVTLELAQRYRTEEDRRTVKAKLTDKGNQLIMKQLELLSNSCRDLLSVLAPDEQRTLVEYLSRFAQSGD